MPRAARAATSGAGTPSDANVEPAGVVSPAAAGDGVDMVGRLSVKRTPEI
jgi:hypothetical protein